VTIIGRVEKWRSIVFLQQLPKRRSFCGWGVVVNVCGVVVVVNGKAVVVAVVFTVT